MSKRKKLKTKNVEDQSSEGPTQKTDAKKNKQKKFVKVGVSKFREYIKSPLETKIPKEEIKDQVKAFDKKDLHFQVVLLSIDLTESFSEFECDTMKEFIDTQFKVSYKTAHKILTQARIAYDAGGADAVGKYTGNALEAMKGLEADERKDVLEYALQSDPKKLTRPVIEEAMIELGYKEEIGDQHKKTKKKISEIYTKIKKSTSRPEFLKNMAEALHQTLQEKDISALLKKLEKIKNTDAN